MDIAGLFNYGLTASGIITCFGLVGAILREEYAENVEPKMASVAMSGCALGMCVAMFMAWAMLFEAIA